MLLDGMPAEALALAQRWGAAVAGTTASRCSRPRPCEGAQGCGREQPARARACGTGSFRALGQLLRRGRGGGAAA